MLHARLRILATTTVLAAAMLANAAPAQPPVSQDPDEHRPDEVALRAVAHHWDRAEADGDVAYLSQLLAPEYRSIGSQGAATPRAALLDQAERVHNSPEGRAERHKASEAFLRAHPTEIAVVIHGAVGIVSFYNPARGPDHSVRGSDVFVYEADHWRAIYSIHNSAE